MRMVLATLGLWVLIIFCILACFAWPITKVILAVIFGLGMLLFISFCIVKLVLSVLKGENDSSGLE